MTEKSYNVLFLCTQNSARSIMAECILNQLGSGKFRAFSAGSYPSGRINPDALRLLGSSGHATGKLRSKSWDEFAQADAPQMDFVFTVCDKAAGELCPVWPGQPVTAHWPFQDPAAFEGGEVERIALFAEVYGQIRRRIEVFVNSPFESLDQQSLKARVAGLGEPETEKT